MYKRNKKDFRKKPTNNRKRNFSSKKKGGAGFSKFINSAKFVNKSVKDKKEYLPENIFNEFDIDEKLKTNIARRGYKNPTEIQDKTIPLIIQGRDVIGVANTGTGKTVAFLLPLVDKVLRNRKEKVFIITPTRELAFQIGEEFFSLTKDINISSVVCVGGSNMFNQIRKIKEKPNFVIGTPGRLKDLVERKRLSINDFSTIVIDEADRMLDMGFIDDVRFLTSNLSDIRQSLLFSATFSPEIEKITKLLSEDPVKISVIKRETGENIEQDVVHTKNKEEKIGKLCKLLSNKKDFKKVLIFGKTKRGVENLSKDLVKKGFNVVSIHGDKSQSQRNKSLSLFKKGAVQALIATDVAARGLDIVDVTHVINFDVPATYDDYIHRIGRTGRADKVGFAITFV
jgi:ATP-dependent RNA helicase RhlE